MNQEIPQNTAATSVADADQNGIQGLTVEASAAPVVELDDDLIFDSALATMQVSISGF